MSKEVEKVEVIRPVTTTDGMAAAVQASALGTTCEIVRVGLTATPGEASKGDSALEGEAFSVSVADGLVVNDYQVNVPLSPLKGEPGTDGSDGENGENGKYGPVSENYLISDQQINEYRAEPLNRKRSELLLQATAWESGVRVMRAADTQRRLDELDRYREALMRIEEQPGYPQRVKFPTPPWI